MKEYKITVDLNNWGKKLLNKDKFEITRNFEDIPELEDLYSIVKEECPAELFNKQSICIRLISDTNFNEIYVVKVYVSSGKWYYGNIDDIAGGALFVRCPGIKHAVESGEISRDEIARWRDWNGSCDFKFMFDERTGFDLTRKKNDKWYIVPASEAETEIYYQEMKNHRLIDQILMTAVTYYREVANNGNYSFMEDLLDRLDREGVIETVAKIFDTYRDNVDFFDDKASRIHQVVKTFDEMGETDIEDFDQKLAMNYDRC